MKDVKLGILLLLGIVCCTQVCGSDLKIENVRIINRMDAGDALSINLDISWQNAWSNSKNYDAIWVFIKFIREDGGYIHPRVSSGGHSMLMNHIPWIPGRKEG